ncbi:MAG TPA: ABC transporter permease [Acetobacteraceae bacterium]|nr:ABC transporter permease [Acetobacteraceae bacterium]
MQFGEKFSPVHGLAEVPGGHVHTEIAYEIVGRLAPTGTPWDRAILVPIESVWELHGLGNGHPPGVERIGPPWEVPAGVPAVVVKPRSFAGAYQLRARYRTDRSTAIFPGEVLSGLFRTLGDVRALLSAMALAASVLVVAAVFLAFSALVSARAREHAVLRAIGASPGYILAALWLELGTILAVAVVLGTGLGWLAARIAASVLGRAAGLSVSVSLGWNEVRLSAAILAAGLIAAAAPALVGLRAAPGALLKG